MRYSNTDEFNSDDNFPYDGMRRGRRVRKRKSLLPAIMLTLFTGFLMGAAIMFFMFPVIVHFEKGDREEPLTSTVEIQEAAPETDEPGSDELEFRELESGELESVGSDTDELGFSEFEEDAPDAENSLSPDGTDDIYLGETDTNEADMAAETVSQDESQNEEERGLIENLKQALLNGEGTLEALRQTFKGQIMVVSNGKFHFFPILESMAKNDYTQENLVENEDGSLDYILPDGSRARRGVDVSKYQGDIDWEKVKNAGIDFAFIRAGIRGYGTGALVPDEKFYENAVAASKQHIEIGAYFFSQAVNEEEAIEEAQLVIDSLSGNRIPLPVVYDLEYVEGGRINSLSVQERTRNCLAFCSTIREAGYEAMVYGNMETMLLMLDIEELTDLKKWFSFYRPGFYYPYDYAVWQYTDSGYVDGIKGKVDMNLMLKKN